MLGSLRLYIALATLVVFAGTAGLAVLFHAKYKAEQARNVQLEQTISVQSATIEQGRQNRRAVQESAAVQQTIAQNAAPIHQAIEDSTPEQPLNEIQKRIAMCILNLYRGMLVVGKSPPCSGKAGDILPEATKAVPDRATNR